MTKSDTMANTSMNVSLPETLKDYVQERVAEGTFSNPSDYVRALIREDRKRRAEERLDELLMEGINSGPAEPMTEQDWADIRADVEDHIARRQRERA
jgi:antitoxin ParD1/3/4